MSKTERESVRDGDFFIPTKVGEWKELVNSGKLQGKTIHDIVNMDSGSRVQMQQFVMLRALWPLSKTAAKIKVDAAKLGLQLVWAHAEHILDQSREYKKYLELIASGMPIEALTETSQDWPGAFTPLLEFQGECAEDEAIVNTSLVLLILVLRRLFCPSDIECTMKRIRLEAQFKKAQYTAYTAGAIWSKLRRSLYAIFEVKRMNREQPQLTRFRMQETTELVGWIFENQEGGDIFGNK
ncbi:hypothetical protein BJY00DRAFT_308369 [Aspergillus carlsbadensis]|nr:hypothetical protein BJY00DRAFT_308369 [Aspergillus carlsbadensis]